MKPRQILKGLFPNTPKPSIQPDPSEARIHERLTPLVDALADPDDSRRRTAVEQVVRTCIPAVVGRLIERLVNMLGEGTSRGPALASLAGFGNRALPSLTLRFTRTRDPALQSGIVEALTQIAPGLPLAQRLDLMTEIMILARFAADESVSRALDRLVAVARRATEAAARTG